MKCCYQFRITQSALEDFEEILAYSRANFPSATERFGNAVLDHLDLLKTFPYVGSPVAGHPGIRQLVHTPIVIYYRVDEDTDDRWNARPVDQFTVTKPQASLNVQFSVPATVGQSGELVYSLGVTNVPISPQRGSGRGDATKMTSIRSAT